MAGPVRSVVRRQAPVMVMDWRLGLCTFSDGRLVLEEAAPGPATTILQTERTGLLNRGIPVKTTPNMTLRNTWTTPNSTRRKRDARRGPRNTRLPTDNSISRSTDRRGTAG